MRRKKVYKKRSNPAKGENKKVRNAKKLELDNGLKFRSKLELFTYQKLLEAGITDFKYEEDKFVLLDAFEYPNESYEAYEVTDRTTGVKTKGFGDVSHNIRSMTYLPDFTRINHEDKTGWIIEVKGYANDAWPNKWKFFKSYLKANGYNLTLYKPNTQGNVLKCIEMIRNKYYT